VQSYQLSIVNYQLLFMPKLNPYESPQKDSRLPLAESRPPLPQGRKSPPLWEAKPPAFGLAVILQAICLVAAFICLMFSGSTNRRGMPNDILTLAAIMLVFAGLLGVGILIVAKRYNLQGWAVYETVLLMLLVFVFAASYTN